MPPPPATMESQFGHDQVMDLCINKSIVNTPLSCSDNATWNFVQMNMTLLPIARPVPVSISHRFQEGAVLSGVKPSTPTQKLHRRLRQHTTNISPRRHDLDCNAIRPTATTTSHPKSSNRGRPPTPRLTCGAKRKISETWHVPAIDAPMPPPAVSVSMRMRSFSEDLYTPATRSDCGYSSDPAGQMPLGYSPLDRSASLSYGCAAKSKGLYKGKRILELQNEDRRFHPDDRGTAPPSSKRSKHQS